jgi:hypothetical protein
MLEDGYSYELDASGSGACCVGGLWLLLLQLYFCKGQTYIILKLLLAVLINFLLVSTDLQHPCVCSSVSKKKKKVH